MANALSNILTLLHSDISSGNTLHVNLSNTRYKLVSVPTVDWKFFVVVNVETNTC